MAEPKEPTQTPRSVLMEDALWQEIGRAAARRQLRTGERTTASDIIRAASRMLVLEEQNDRAAPSKRVAARLLEGTRMGENTIDVVRATVKDVLLEAEGDDAAA